MYLKELHLTNYRKFRDQNNVLSFVGFSNQDDEVNMATGTTLIIGKNNSGKTSVINSLEKLTSIKSFDENDFNYNYIFDLFEKYKTSDYTVTPYFQVKVVINTCKSDLTTNMNPFVPISATSDGTFDVDIIMRYEIADDESFFSDVRSMFESHLGKDDVFIFRCFLEILSNTKFKKNYYDINGDITKGFSMKDLIEVKTVKANNIEGSYSLTKSFGKIVNYRYENLIGNDKKELEDTIYGMNEKLNKSLDKNHTSDINKSLSTIESKEKMEIRLSSNMNIKKILSGSIVYEYLENGFHIPENQYGLGYTNLMSIIADIIDYIEKYPETAFQSMVNIICIEEPETYMHPQMEELFIKNINEAINTLLKDKGIDVNVQLVITSHSQHILNSKIHEGNSFNNINYMSILENTSYVVKLSDTIIVKGEKQKETLNFIKKHIKYKVSELFFADALIFVEGVTEETLVRFYIDQHPHLSKYYITVFNINGAHGKVYHNLIKLLRIPSLIITDLDILRSKDEKKNNVQISDLSEKSTTNETIREYTGKYELVGVIPPIESDNILITFQEKINGYYPTSFEEAFILKNYSNNLLNTSLRDTIKNTYIDTHKGNADNLKSNSYKLQTTLSSKKTLFTNNLLFNMSNCEDSVELPTLPNYISSGLDWLYNELKGVKHE